MTNYEWLLKQNEELIKECLIDGVAVKHNGDITRCGGTTCDNCIFGRLELVCSEAQREWLDAEHNPYTIPLDTPIDAKVLVSSDGKHWYQKHFAGFGKDENRPYHTFTSGATSWSNVDPIPYSWAYCKLAEGGENND